jgi:hypothetical protein
MVAVVYKHKSALLDVGFEVLSLFLRKLHQLMSTQIAKWTFENLGTAEFNDLFLFIYRNRRVLYQAIDQIGRHTLIRIPIAGVVLEAGEEEISSWQFPVGSHGDLVTVSSKQ